MAYCTCTKNGEMAADKAIAHLKAALRHHETDSCRMVVMQTFLVDLAAEVAQECNAIRSRNDVQPLPMAPAILSVFAEVHRIVEAYGEHAMRGMGRMQVQGRA